MWANSKNRGFTIVELLIVIVVIAILAAITVVAYNGIQQRAANSKRDAELTTYMKAMRLARINTGTMLRDITGSQWSVGSCNVTSGNPGHVEPRDLAKTHVCWTRYYDNLTKIGTAAQMNLDSLRSGDPRGNPYMIDENQGETGPCATDRVYTFSGNGTAAYSEYAQLPAYEC
jgi:prepilin-type N-terminal cleavage/methylation domain-containing protein